uniref:Uncharacterized protein n=1 Tax=Seriola dumerili TaxID=41447 RepID=A0A3B4UNF9_SERDU
MGLQAIMQTIMMGKMEMVLPDMYMMNRFMGICFKGPRATSQQRCATQGETEDDTQQQISVIITSLLSYMLISNGLSF